MVRWEGRGGGVSGFIQGWGGGANCVKDFFCFKDGFKIKYGVKNE